MRYHLAGAHTSAGISLRLISHPSIMRRTGHAAASGSTDATMLLCVVSLTQAHMSGALSTHSTIASAAEAQLLKGLLQ